MAYAGRRSESSPSGARALERARRDVWSGFMIDSRADGRRFRRADAHVCASYHPGVCVRACGFGLSLTHPPFALRCVYAPGCQMDVNGSCRLDVYAFGFWFVLS